MNRSGPRDYTCSFTRRLSRTALGAAILALPFATTAALAQDSFQPDGDPFLVNTFTDGFQENADVARRSTGFVVVWESEAEFNEAIYSQLFDDTGNRIGNEFLVSLGDKSQTDAAVAWRGGDFVTVWQTANEDNILGQLFDAQGARVGDQGVVNTYTEDTQEFPAIDSDAAGNFVVVYESFKWPGDDDGDAIVGQRFSSTAVRQGDEFLVNTVIADDQQDPAVGRQPGGDFLVAWESDDTNNSGIFAQIFDANGAKQGLEFEVPTVSENNQETPDVGAWPGGYVVAWESPDGEGKGIYARRFDSNGDALGGQFLVNTIQDVDQRFPAVAVFDSGEFLIVWEDQDLGIAGQEFDANGNPAGGQFDVSISEKREQKPRLALRDDGFMVAWFGAGAEADDDIFGRTYSVPEPGAAAGGLAALASLVTLVRIRRT